MTPEERDEVLGRVCATWPTPKMTDGQQSVWHEHLGPLDRDRAYAAVVKLERTSKSRPSIADFHNAYGPHVGDTKSTVTGVKPQCGMCEDGWVDLTPNGDPHSAHRTMARCPNGCMPKTMKERMEMERREREQDARRIRAKQHPQQQSFNDDAVRDYSDSAARRDRGPDPDEVF